MAEFLLRVRSPPEVETDFNCQAVPQQRLLSLGSTLVEVSSGVQTGVCVVPLLLSSRQTKTRTEIWG